MGPEACVRFVRQEAGSQLLDSRATGWPSVSCQERAFCQASWPSVSSELGPGGPSWEPWCHQAWCLPAAGPPRCELLRQMPDGMNLAQDCCQAFAGEQGLELPPSLLSEWLDQGAYVSKAVIFLF